MRIENMRESGNVEDRRGLGGGGRLAVGGGVGGVIMIILYLVLGGNPLALMQGSGGGGQQALSPQEEQIKAVVTRTLGDTEDVWTDLFAQMGRRYEPPRLVLFSGGTQSGCGFAESATGPFYCPADHKVYIDLSFYTDLMERRLGAGGDFAQAYVVAHEVGHHVQNLLGTADQMSAMRERMSEREANAMSVRLELQADFYAGVWAHWANKKRKVLEPGDIEEGLRAAAAVGDDRLQRMTRGTVAPDTFTHGTSEQRVRWFRRGLETGDPGLGNTFASESP